MVSLRSIATFLAAVSCVLHLALGENVPRNPGSTVKVLTGNVPRACTAQQVATLKTRLDEAITLAEAASAALKAEGASSSDSFKSFLGNADPKQMDAQHYTPIANLRSVTLKSVTSDERATAPPKETLLMCLPVNDDRCSTKDGKANGYIALALRKGVFFCPLFFEKMTLHDLHTKTDFTSTPLSLAESKQKYLAGKDDSDVLAARDLLHEFQHVFSMVGDHWLTDLYVKSDDHKVVVPKPDGVHGQKGDVVAVYSTEDCKGIPDDKKRLNPQNIANYALDVYARAETKPVGPASSKPKTPKRFEAIYHRGVEKAAVANRSTKNTAPKQATGAADTDTTGRDRSTEKHV